MDKVIRLLHEVDGQLGLAVYRNEHDDRWKNESKELITRISATINELSARSEGASAPERRATHGGGKNHSHSKESNV